MVYLSDFAHTREFPGSEIVLAGNILRKLKDYKLSKSQQKIADFITENEKTVFTMTAAQLAKATGVSEATVVRFASILGFDGYHQFQKALAAEARNQLTAFERMELLSKTGEGADVIKKVLKSDMEKIERTMSALDYDSFDRAVKALLSAKNIYIAGVRSSAALVKFCGFYFELLFDNCHAITGSAGEDIIQQLFHAGKGDVVIGISFPRYSAGMVKAMEFAKNRGAFIISVTDSPMSPIVPHSSCVLLAESSMDSFADSLVAPMSILNALIFSIGYSMKNKTKEIFDELENIWKDYEVYDFNS